MRWKLVLIVSLLAALAGAGASLALSHWLLGSTMQLSPARFNTADFAALGALLMPLAAATFASIFVYRHTSRRRPLQAIVTALLTVALIVALLFAADAYLTSRRPPAEPLLSPVNNRV